MRPATVSTATTRRETERTMGAQWGPWPVGAPGRFGSSGSTPAGWHQQPDRRRRAPGLHRPRTRRGIHLLIRPRRHLDAHRHGGVDPPHGSDTAFAALDGVSDPTD